MNTPDKPWSTQLQPTNTHQGCIRTSRPTTVLSCAVRKPERKKSPPSLINSGKIEAVRTDHREKIGFVQSENWNLTIRRESRTTLRIPKRAVPILPRSRDPTKADSSDLGEAENSWERWDRTEREDC